MSVIKTTLYTALEKANAAFINDDDIYDYNITTDEGKECLVIELPTGIRFLFEPNLEIEIENGRANAKSLSGEQALFYFQVHAARPINESDF